jgi:hypothetical protein
MTCGDKKFVSLFQDTEVKHDESEEENETVQ